MRRRKLGKCPPLLTQKDADNWKRKVWLHQILVTRDKAKAAGGFSDKHRQRIYDHQMKLARLRQVRNLSLEERAEIPIPNDKKPKSIVKAFAVRYRDQNGRVAPGAYYEYNHQARESELGDMVHPVRLIKVGDAFYELRHIRNETPIFISPDRFQPFNQEDLVDLDDEEDDGEAEVVYK